ncbi:hypothetical protein KVH31_13375 [Streptomyces olivaceus]|uniref:hypothetical protein n=1 Tax=Streptomyces olivaceus TaxID=47716 RepID=UPI001CCBD7FD|nr:hypothetical protein [Streptomyces olivaceus]MBZ6207489.1 hypothetical protein [Streptomyces olivaceus]
MRGDDILTRIDDTLDVWEVSGDAMHHQPAEGEPASGTVIVDESGSWAVDARDAFGAHLLRAEINRLRRAAMRTNDAPPRAGH